jgi:flavin-dependent dehydrogenase
MYDVIVVGAGPAGATAAIKCSEQGLKTLFIEKRKLPRNKVCSGMIMGGVAHDLIGQEFGKIPEGVLSSPGHLSGYYFHVPGIGREKVDHFTSLTWRRDLDSWMVQRAREVGAELWEGAEFLSLEEQGQDLLLTVKSGEKKEKLKSKYVIGADGATSKVRGSLFPELRVKYGQVYQEHYEGELDLERDYMHWFYPVDICPASFTAHQKDGLIVFDVGGGPGQTKEILSLAREYLADNHGLDPKLKPVWKGGCLEPALYRELTNNTFHPAKDNVLLIGDAAGFIMPVSGEGIGLGLMSALIAADSIADAEQGGIRPDKRYISGIRGIIAFFSDIYPLFREIMYEAKGGGQALPKMIRDAYQRTLDLSWPQ